MVWGFRHQFLLQGKCRGFYIDDISLVVKDGNSEISFVEEEFKLGDAIRDLDGGPVSFAVLYLKCQLILLNKFLLIYFFNETVELCGMATSSDELITDIDARGSVIKEYRKDEEAEVRLTFHSPESKYRFF